MEQMFSMINPWCAFYSVISAIILYLGFDHCDFLRADVESTSAKFYSLVWSLLWVSEIPSPLVQKYYTKSGTGIFTFVLSQLACSRAK